MGTISGPANFCAEHFGDLNELPSNSESYRCYAMPILPSADRQKLTGALKDMFAFARRSEGPGKSLGPLQELLVDGEVTLSP